jgi:hypothetical protein
LVREGQAHPVNLVKLGNSVMTGQIPRRDLDHCLRNVHAQEFLRRPMLAYLQQISPWATPHFQDNFGVKIDRMQKLFKELLTFISKKGIVIARHKT